MRVTLPNIISRPLTERVAQVDYFLRCEARSLARDINLDMSLMNQWMMSQVRGNIGELKNQIKVMCASAWSDNDNPKHITLSSPRPQTGSGETLVISHRDSASTVDVASLLPKAMRDDVIFKEFCHSANTLLLNRKLEQLLTTIGGVLSQVSPYSGYHAINELENLTGLAFN